MMKSAGIGIKADCCKGREKMGSGVKKELLQLLREDEDVRKVLKDIIRKEAGDDRTQNGRTMTYSREVMKHDFEADSLPDKKDEGIGDMVRKLKNVIDTLRGRNRELNESIQSAMEGEANAREELRSMSLRAQQLENTVSALKERNEVLAQEAGQYKAAVNKLHENIQSLRNDLEVQKKKSLALENEAEQKEEALQSRFAAGYACFMAYQELDAECKRDLSGVIRHGEDFESFICCLAQSRTLEKIWDEMLACVMNGSQDSVNILDDIFNYSMSLINKTLSQPYYERLSVQEGAPYDTDLERLVPDSPNQGQVQAVYLEGFRNRYSHQVIRKSLVSL